MTRGGGKVVFAALILAFFFPCVSSAQSAKPGEWERVVELGRKEGKVVISIPATSELRQALEDGFKKRYGINLESVPARGTTVTRRIVDETKAGISYFDIHIGGSESIVTGLLSENVLEPVEPNFILPQVKDPKQWWGGHIWIDNAKKYIYAFQAYQTESLWHNTDLVKAEEIRSFDDLLQPKWQGKIAILDPRTPGSGASMWSYLRAAKGEEYLKKLVAQKLQVGRDQRLLSENLAKGKSSVVIGVTYYSLAPFIKAGLPVKPLPNPREGVYVSGGSGHLTIIKNPPHPNAAKVFANWLLGKEGQEVFSQAIGQATRRLDVDTRGLKAYGMLAAKDGLTLDQYYKLENQSEKKVYEMRDPGADLARKLLD
ncbi:MAG TPA: extracellular solute-binding protein [Candidatus Binatia bacterium]|nr:extracellular solute-binding protein [Candidatus Binatia bacterium]